MTHLSPRAIEAFRRGFKACRPVERVACQDFGMQQDDLLNQQIEAGLAALEAEGMVVVPLCDLLGVLEVADRNEYHPSISRIKSALQAAQGGDDAGQ